jgi:hypothetical protein
MGYKIIFRTQNGNTSVEVEDLGRSGTVCTHCTRGEYPGVCQHCGKLHIRYLAHVAQDVADTLLRATKEDVPNPLPRTDAEIAELGIALLGGKCKKEMNVGCVCVAKYLEDCGVDAGLAARLQGEVSKVTGLLQQAAALEACKSSARLAESVRRASIVARLRARHQALREAGSRNPRLRDQAAYQAYYAAQQMAFKEFEEANERWSRENHGYNLYYNMTPAEDVLLAHFNTKLRHVERKLDRYTAGATFRA